MTACNMSLGETVRNVFVALLIGFVITLLFSCLFFLSRFDYYFSPHQVFELSNGRIVSCKSSVASCGVLLFDCDDGSTYMCAKDVTLIGDKK